VVTIRPRAAPHRAAGVAMAAAARTVRAVLRRAVPRREGRTARAAPRAAVLRRAVLRAEARTRAGLRAVEPAAAVLAAVARPVEEPGAAGPGAVALARVEQAAVAPARAVARAVVATPCRLGVNGARAQGKCRATKSCTRALWRRPAAPAWTPASTTSGNATNRTCPTAPAKIRRAAPRGRSSANASEQTRAPAPTKVANALRQMRVTERTPSARIRWG
jgi:hypothetical protein